MAFALCAALTCCAHARAQDTRPAEESTQEEIRALHDRIDALERTLQTREGAAAPSEGAFGQGNLFNPSLTFFFDMGGSLSSNGNDPRYNRFNLREIEMDARAPIAPFADGVFILAFVEEFDDDEGEFENEVEVEEAYIDFHTLPWDTSITGGKFRNAFGRNNVLHTHDLPQVDRPLAVQAFLGEEGLVTIGASADWLVPNPWDSYIELTAQVVNADGGEESPILGGGAGAEDPAFLGHVKVFEDVGQNASVEVGGSYLWGRTTDDADFDANVFGIDGTYQWRNPQAPDRKSFLFQTELFFSDSDVEDAGGAFRNSAFGTYAFAQWQLDRNWYAGVRVDYTDFPAIEERAVTDRDWAVSPYVSFYLTEFLRLRFEYQHLEQRTDGSWDSEEIFFFQITYLFGAHPPHPYWVNR